MKVFRVIDFETTGLPPNADVIEVGKTDLTWEGTSMVIGDPASTLTNPGDVTIDPGAQAVNHIHVEDLKGAPHPDAVLLDLESGADFIVAHNLRFEEHFFTPSLPTICTMKCARELIPEATKHTNQYLRYYLNLPVDRTKAEPPHRAGPDAYVTAHLLKHLLMMSAKMGGDFVGRLVNMTSSTTLMTRIPFGKYKGLSFSEVAKMDRGYLQWILKNDRAEPEVKRAAETALGSRS